MIYAYTQSHAPPPGTRQSGFTRASPSAPVLCRPEAEAWICGCCGGVPANQCGDGKCTLRSVCIKTGCITSLLRGKARQQVGRKRTPGYTVPTRSWGFLARRLQERTVPCSVPTMNLVGPACYPDFPNTSRIRRVWATTTISVTLTLPEVCHLPKCLQTCDYVRLPPCLRYLLMLLLHNIRSSNVVLS